MKYDVRRFREEVEQTLRRQQEAGPSLSEYTEPLWLVGRLYAALGDYPALIEALRQMWGETFAEVPTHSPEVMRDMRLRAPAVEGAVRNIVAERVRDKIREDDAVALSLIFATWNIEVEDAYAVVSHAYFRGFCPFHRTDRVTSPDGRFDAVCGACEDDAMDFLYDPEMDVLYDPEVPETGADDVAN